MWSGSTATCATAMPSTAALVGVDRVVHLAARVGVGQSMYEIAEYTSVNGLGTSVLLEALLSAAGAIARRRQQHEHLRRGQLRAAVGRARRGGRAHARAARGRSLGAVRPARGGARAGADARAQARRRWRRCTRCPSTTRSGCACSTARRTACRPWPCASSTSTAPSRRCPTRTRACSPSSPARLLNRRPPLIFEDGNQRRDFVSVHDVARACRLALRAESAAGSAINIGSGRGASVAEIARAAGGNARLPGAAARDHRQVPGRRHPPLLRRHQRGPRTARLRAGGRPRRGDGGAGGVARRPPGRRRRRAGHAGAGRAGAHRVSTTALHHGTTLITGGAGFVGTNVAAHVLAGGGRVRLLDNLARPGVGDNVRWLLERFGTERLAITEADVADRPTVRDAVRDADRVVHLAAQVAVTTSLDDPLHDFDVNAARHAGGARGAASPRPPRPAAVHLDEQGLWRARRRHQHRRRGDRYEPTDPVLAAHGIGESRPLAFCTPVRLLEGRRRPVRARLRALLRPADGRVPDELHLRAAPVGQRGPGLGRPLPAPRTSPRRRSRSSATAGRCATCCSSRIWSTRWTGRWG